MKFLAAQNIDWEPELEQPSDNIMDHLALKQELRENKSQMTPAEIRQAWRHEVRRYVEEDRRIRAAWDQRKRRERQAQGKDHQKREQHNLRRIAIPPVR